MLSCSPTRRSWSATCRASGSARRRPGSGAAAGRSAPKRRMPIGPGGRACSSCAWPDCPAGDNPTAAAARRAVAVSSRKPTRTPRWPALRNLAMTASTAARSSACPPIPRAAPAATMIVPARQDQRLQPLPESALFAAIEDVHVGRITSITMQRAAGCEQHVRRYLTPGDLGRTGAFPATGY